MKIATSDSYLFKNAEFQIYYLEYLLRVVTQISHVGILKLIETKTVSKELGQMDLDQGLKTFEILMSIQTAVYP